MNSTFVQSVFVCFNLDRKSVMQQKFNDGKFSPLPIGMSGSSEWRKANRCSVVFPLLLCVVDESCSMFSENGDIRYIALDDNKGLSYDIHMCSSWLNSQCKKEIMVNSDYSWVSPDWLSPSFFLTFSSLINRSG